MKSCCIGIMVLLLMVQTTTISSFSILNLESTGHNIHTNFAASNPDSIPKIASEQEWHTVIAIRANSHEMSGVLPRYSVISAPRMHQVVQDRNLTSPNRGLTAMQSAGHQSRSSSVLSANGNILISQSRTGGLLPYSSENASASPSQIRSGQPSQSSAALNPSGLKTSRFVHATREYHSDVAQPRQERSVSISAPESATAAGSPDMPCDLSSFILKFTFVDPKCAVVREEGARNMQPASSDAPAERSFPPNTSNARSTAQAAAKTKASGAAVALLVVLGVAIVLL